jgi:hypothetical protein
VNATTLRALTQRGPDGRPAWDLGHEAEQNFERSYAAYAALDGGGEAVVDFAAGRAAGRTSRTWREPRTSRQGVRPADAPEESGGYQVVGGDRPADSETVTVTQGELDALRARAAHDPDEVYRQFYEGR